MPWNRLKSGPVTTRAATSTIASLVLDIAIITDYRCISGVLFGKTCLHSVDLSTENDTLAVVSA